MNIGGEKVLTILSSHEGKSICFESTILRDSKVRLSIEDINSTISALGKSSFATFREKVLSRRFGKKFFFSRRFGKKTSFQAESALLTTHIITDIFCSIDYTIYHIRVLNTCITKHAYSFESSLPLEACRASFLLAFYNRHR